MTHRRTRDHTDVGWEPLEFLDLPTMAEMEAWPTTYAVESDLVERPQHEGGALA